MPDPCIGIMGRIFGHKFTAFLIKQTPPEPKGDFWSVSLPSFPSVIGAQTKREYTVRCARCGSAPAAMKASATEAADA